MSFKVIEDQWNESFRWFLIDDGAIQYSFKDLETANDYKRKGRFDYMLLTDIDHITHDTMLDPHEIRSWEGKIQSCVEVI